MTKTKRVLALLLCLLMCLSLFPASALAAELEDTEPSAPDTLLEEPVEETEWPVEEAEEPAEEAEEPAEETEEPAEETEEPAEETEEPAEEAEEPAEETEEPAEETEEPAEETEEPAEETEEPAEETEEPVEETEGIPEETAEEPADTQLPEEEEIEITVDQAPERYVPGGGGDNGELLDAYAQKQLDSLRPQGASVQYVRSIGNSLSGVNRTVYFNLKNRIASVASGQESVTIFEIPVSSLGLPKTSWTAADLGLSTLVADGTFSDEAMAAVNAQVGFALREVISCLLADCPYELYWYDKTVGTSYQPYSFTGSTRMISITGDLSFTFAVSTEFDDGSYVDIRNGDGTTTRYFCGVDSSLISGISAAVLNAAQIVEDYLGTDDYHKLLGYKNEICDRVSYNSGAASGGADYGNPWQIIWVFDGDDSTNVVCEGYAKAFQYLCDLTQFSGGVTAYTVTGTMSGGTGAGAHMWNIVHMENGKNYLVDVTNCDGGSVGAPDKLFLAGHSSGSLNGGYVFTANGIPVTYSYESKIRAIFSDSDLTISGGSYLDDIYTPAPGVVLTLTHLEQQIADFVESGASSITIRYQGSGSFVVDRNVTIPVGMNFYLPNGTLLVENGVTMTVALGGKVTAKHADIQGTLTVLGTFSMDTASSVLSVSGTLDNRGSVLILDPNFQRTANMTAGGGRYYVEHMSGDEAAVRSACAIAAADSDSAVTHEIYTQAQIALTQDLTIPANVRMRIAVGKALSYGSGVTLTLNGRIESRANFDGLGTTVNNGLLAVMRGAEASFGPYEGSGVLKVYADTNDPFDHLTGLDQQLFASTLDVDNYWALSLVRHTIQFVNFDGTVLQTGSVPHGTVPAYTGETPTKEADAEHTFSFSGWDPEPAPATADATYIAQFSETLNEYTVQFVDHDGTVLQSDTLAYGATPSYTGAAPTREADAQYTYSFTGWSPAITSVTGDATYTAQYSTTVNNYTVQFVNYDGTVLQSDTLAYGATPAYTGAEPIKPATEQYSYHFTGWNPAITTVTGNATYTAQFANSGLNEYLVRFVDYDGTVLQSTLLTYGSTPDYTEAFPSRPADAQYTYAFAGWSPTIASVTGDATYTAQYSTTVNNYTVQFVNYDGTVLQSDTLAYGATPVFSGANPNRPEDAQYIYSFSGWDPAITTVTGNATYTAQYSGTVKEYLVKFVNYDGTVLQSDTLAYGATPAYTGATPTKPATAQYSYTFTGWDPEITTVMGTATYIAQYSETVNTFLIKFVNYDGTVLQNRRVAYGVTPSYTGAAPTKPATAQYSYTFTGWDPAIAAVTGNATYTAQFTETVNSYTVEFVNYDGTVLQSDVLAYGAMPSYRGAAPTKPATAQYSYAFTGWGPAIAAVTGNVAYMAQYRTIVNKYTVEFVNYDGTVLQTGELAYGVTPSYTGATPTRAGTAQYSYSFTGWDPEIAAVTGNATYTAQFTETLNSYTVEFVNYDGTVLQSDTLPYGETPSYTGAAPTRPADAQYNYTFTGWDPAIAAVTGNATYTAVFRSSSTGWREIDGKRYYLDENGQPLCFWQKIDGKWYHFSSTGVLDTGWLKSNGKWYYMGGDGAMQTGLITVGGKRYYLNEDGAMQTGWQKIDGKWYYFKSSGAAQTGWLQLSGKWYYFGEDGVMATGWTQVGSKWYYMNSSGVMQTGWVKSGGKWFYFKDNGAMATGWLKLSGKWYYFQDNGAMLAGWLKVGNTWYYFESSGAMVTGWKQIKGTWYYFKDSGAMAVGWLKLDGKWYYFESSGAMVTGSKTIGGKTYNFNASGVCLNP